jgi:hypothetical protein
MRSHLVTAVLVASLAFALSTGLVIRAHRRQVAAVQQAEQAQRDAQAQLAELMANLRTKEPEMNDLEAKRNAGTLDADLPDASGRLISDPGLGDYPPEPPFKSRMLPPKAAPLPSPSNYGPSDPTNRAR